METHSDTPTGDIFDSRDVIARITDLETCGDNLDEYEQEELEGLQSLAKEASEMFSEWESGVEFICEDYFEEYARDTAVDLGLISSDTQWPATCIDWEQAANELKADYSFIEIDGAEYWAKA